MKPVYGFFLQKFKQFSYADTSQCEKAVDDAYERVAQHLKEKKLTKWSQNRLRSLEVKKKTDNQTLSKESSNPKEALIDQVISKVQSTTKSTKSKSIGTLNQVIDEKDRLNFVKRMEEERKKVKELHDANIEDINKKILEDVNIEHQLKAEKERKKIEAKIQEIAKLREKVETDRIERHKRILLGDQEYSKVSTQKPLYKQIEDRFLSNSIIPELEKQREIISKIKENNKPISLVEIDEHDINYRKKAKEAESKRKQQVLQRKIDLAAHEATINYYKSPLLDKVLSQDQDKEKAEIEKVYMHKLLARKALQYGDIATEMHKPKMSSQKHFEIEKRKLQIKNSRVDTSADYSFKTNSSISNHQRAQSMSSAKISTKNVYSESTIGSNESFSIQKPKSNIIASHKRSASNSSKNDMAVDKSVDYLMQRRVARQKSSDNDMPVFKPLDWTSVLSDNAIDKSQKIEKIKKLAKRAEEKAKMYERCKPGFKNASFEVQDNVDKVYIDSIKAKLSVLPIIMQMA